MKKKTKKNQKTGLAGIFRGHHKKFYVLGGLFGAAILGWALVGQLVLAMEPTSTIVASPGGLTWSAPAVACGGRTSSEAYTAQWNDVAGAQAYEYTIVSPDPNPDYSTSISVVSASEYSYYFNASYGTYTFTVRAIDVDGLKSSPSAPCTIVYEAPKPDDAAKKQDCKEGGWKFFKASYKNQGECVSATNHTTPVVMPPYTD